MRSALWPPSLHLVGSKGVGGAERWVQRYAVALAEQRAPALVGVRAGSAVAGLDMGGLPVRTLPFLSVWDPISRSAVTRLIREQRPAIVQTYMGRATRLTRRTGGAVHLARLGGYYKLAPYRHADAWIGNTRGLCDWMIAGGLPAERVHQIYNFVDAPHPLSDAEVSTLRESLGIPVDALVLVALGRLVPVKGYGVLLAALARLPAQIDGRRWRMLIVGDGPLQAGLAAQAARLGIGERLVWVGWQSVPGPYLQLADLVVFPSRDPETLGNVILEAWAWRRPLLTTRFRGARELARHGEDAWCVPCDDPPALAEGIRYLLADEALRLTLAGQGAKRAAAEFGRETIMAQYLDLYRQLVGA
jgi:hypothetical protein